MALTKQKKCCVPYCNNVQEISKKQFFKIGANLEGREKWPSRIGKAIGSKSQVLFCCEDHFDLPNDAENYIRCKYVPKTKLKLRPHVLPQKKLPLNVCRLCLKLIYNGDDFVEISEKKGAKNAQIIAATVPELDLSITLEPVACVKCFEPLEKYYRIKQNALNSEMIVVNCIKSIVKRSPSRLVKNCEIDLFEEYNNIVELLGKESTKIKETQHGWERQQKTNETTEKIIIQIEEPSDDRHKLEANENNFESGHDAFSAVLTGNKLPEDTRFEQQNYSVINNTPFNEVSVSSAVKNYHEKTNFITENIESLEMLSNTAAEHGGTDQYDGADTPMELSSENMYIHIEREPSQVVEIVTSHL